MTSLTISFDAANVVATLQAMEKSLDGFVDNMNDEFIEWQSDDMHRQHPDSEQDDDGVQTVITPRGARSAHAARVHLKRIKVKGRTVLRAAQARPILMPATFTKLCDRMSKLMDEALKWQVG